MTIQDYKTNHIPHLSPKTPQSTKRLQKRQPQQATQEPKQATQDIQPPKAPKGTTPASTPTRPAWRSHSRSLGGERAARAPERAPMRRCVRVRVPGHSENRASHPSTFGASSMRLKGWQKLRKYVAKSEIDALYKTNR